MDDLTKNAISTWPKGHLSKSAISVTVSDRAKWTEIWDHKGFIMYLSMLLWKSYNFSKIWQKCQYCNFFENSSDLGNSS